MSLIDSFQVVKPSSLLKRFDCQSGQRPLLNKRIAAWGSWVSGKLTQLMES